MSLMLQIHNQDVEVCLHIGLCDVLERMEKCCNNLATRVISKLMSQIDFSITWFLLKKCTLATWVKHFLLSRNWFFQVSCLSLSIQKFFIRLGYLLEYWTFWHNYSLYVVIIHNDKLTRKIFFHLIYMLRQMWKIG